MNEERAFASRVAAGRALAERLAARSYQRPVVLALPRGGVPVGAEIARMLGAPLDVVLVRKIGVPSRPELAVGAVVDGGHPELVVNEDVRRIARVTDDYLERAKAEQLEEIERRRGLYLEGRTPVEVSGATAIVVDDGIATGATVRAALRALRRRWPRRLVLAIPIAPAETVEALRAVVDEAVCLATPEPFYAIGMHYLDFHQVDDTDVVALLRTHAGRGDEDAQDVNS